MYPSAFKHRVQTLHLPLLFFRLSCHGEKFPLGRKKKKKKNELGISTSHFSKSTPLFKQLCIRFRWFRVFFLQSVSISLSFSRSIFIAIYFVFSVYQFSFSIGHTPYVNIYYFCLSLCPYTHIPSRQFIPLHFCIFCLLSLSPSHARKRRGTHAILQRTTSRAETWRRPKCPNGRPATALTICGLPGPSQILNPLSTE